VVLRMCEQFLRCAFAFVYAWYCHSTRIVGASVGARLRYTDFDTCISQDIQNVRMQKIRKGMQFLAHQVRSAWPEACRDGGSP
jgi:hypothetical protein